MVADFKSEHRPGSNRNPRPDCVGIRNPIGVAQRRHHMRGFLVVECVEAAAQRLSVDGDRGQSSSAGGFGMLAAWRRKAASKRSDRSLAESAAGPCRTACRAASGRRRRRTRASADRNWPRRSWRGSRRAARSKDRTACLPGDDGPEFPQNPQQRTCMRQPLIRVVAVEFTHPSLWELPSYNKV